MRGSLPLVVVAVLHCAAALAAQSFPFRLHRDAVAPPVAADSAAATPSAAALAQWVDDLRSGATLNREAALRCLAAAGDAGAAAVRPLCDAADPAVALRARLVFGAVHGVAPEVDASIRGVIAATLEQPWNTQSSSRAILELGAAAVQRARHLLAPAKDAAPSPLYADLTVRAALPTLAASADLQGHLRQSVLSLSAAAAEPLFRLAADAAAPRDQRLHALWLYGVVGAPGRAAHLANLLDDGDPTVRAEAVALLDESLRAADFAAVAAVVGERRGNTRQAVAHAAARVVPADQLTKALDGNSRPQRIVAALALGSAAAGDAARDALVRTLAAAADDHELAAAAAQSLTVFPGEKVTTALRAAFASAESAVVRAAAIGSLRSRLGEAAARIAVTAALFDADPAVSLLAADALSAAEQPSAAPALILAAAADDSGALRARVVSSLMRLFPDAVADLDQSIQPWRHWLDHQDDNRHATDLPWYRASREGAGLVRAVRTRIQSEFFHFGKLQLVEQQALDAAARQAMRDAVGDLTMTGDDLALLQRLLASARLGGPEQVLEALGSIPFGMSTADLVRLANAAAGAMVEHLGDPYSRLAASNDAEGKPRPEWLPGILEDDDNNGFMVKKDGDRLLVDFVLYDSPAWWAGFRRGDQLVKIGDRVATELKPKELRQQLQDQGEFALLRDGWTRPYTFQLEPDQSQHRRMVTHTLLPGGIGYVRLKMFELGCSAKVEAAIAELERKDIAALVLDLRNNPGGTVADAIAICDLFLPEGKVITINETRNGDDDTEEETFKASSKGKNRTYPVAVLVNECSASASEMTSGSLQGNERAVVVGQTSFGKGIGQSGSGIAGFSSDTAVGRTRSQYVLSLTMMRYYVPPERRSIHGTGVVPDLPVRERSAKGAALDKLMRALRHAAFSDYVAMLRRDHAELCTELCRRPLAAEALPGFDELLQQLRRHVDADELLPLLRAAVRTAVLPTADDELFAATCCDLHEDRALQAAVLELCRKAGIDRDAAPELRDLGDAR